jgi:tRNA(Met) cytidine acetyltransferase
LKLKDELNHNYKRSIFFVTDEHKAHEFLIEFIQFIEESMYHKVSGLIVTTINKFKSVKYKKIKEFTSNFENIRTISFDDVSTVLGITTEFLFIDLQEKFDPNKICILFETVRGGGVILLLGKNPDEWLYSVNHDLFSSNDKTESRKSILLDWFLTNLNEVPGVTDNNLSGTQINQRFDPIPYDINLNNEFRNFRVTSDQKRVIISLIDDLLSFNKLKTCSVLLANRGRGKSAAVGIALSQLVFQRKNKPLSILISAPNLLNVQTLFKFIIQGLKLNQIKFKVIKNDERIHEITIAKKIRIFYIPPSEIDRNPRSDFIIIDEAAAISVEILRGIIKVNRKIVLISTVHGYEGASRGFYHKIINYIRNQQQISLTEYSLGQPIRYLQNDPIEKLLNDLFLLDVELDPSHVNSQEVIHESLALRKYPNPSNLFSKKGISNLRQLFGISIYAHYRNQPNDLLLIADSGKHFLTGLYGSSMKNKNILLTSSQLAFEGEMSDNDISKAELGEFIEGNLIPSVAIRHFSSEFARFKGIRVVRLASHPSLIDKGYGRITVEKTLEEFKSYDWIGVSYGATVKLVKFWKKFDFKTVHIRPTKTFETGEWNIIVIRANSTPAKRFIDQVSSDFQFQFISLLKHSLHSMKPELVLQILRSSNGTPEYKPRITPSGHFRLQNYLKGNINFLLAVDVVYELVVTYFVAQPSMKLSSSQKLLLVSRILQGRTWSQTLAKTGLDWKAANRLIEKAIQKLADTILQ